MPIRRFTFQMLALLLAAGPLCGQQDVAFDTNKQYELEIVTWTADVKTEGLTWEWLVGEYQRFRPNVKVTKDIQSVRTYEAWATTQFKSGLAPDIMQSFPRKAHKWGAEQGHLLPLRKYLYEPNEHDKRNRPTWMAGLYEELLEQNADPYYGEIWTIPISLNTQRFYYNKDIFKRLNVAVPTTFTELGRVCRQIRERSAGEIAPIAMSKSGAWLDYLGAAVNMPLIEEFDLVKPDGSVTEIEVLVAALQGKWNARTEGMYSFPKLMKKMNDEGWFQDDWDGFDTNQADNLFTNRKAAITREGYWMKEGFEKRITGAFEFGVMPEPKIDKEFVSDLVDTDRDIGQMLELMASYGSELAVTKKCKERGRLPAAIDFLKFMTRPETAMEVARKRGAMPSTRDLEKDFEESDPDILAFRPQVGGRPGGPNFYNVSIPMQTCFNGVMPLYVSGKEDLEWTKEFMERFHDRFIDLRLAETKESTRRGIFKAVRLYAGFIYEQDELRRRDDRHEEVGAEWFSALTRMGMTLDNLKNTEDNVTALIAAAWPEEGAEGYRHVPMVSKEQAAAMNTIGEFLIGLSVITLVVVLMRKKRFNRMLGFPEKGIYLFILPTMLFVIVFRYYPALSGIYHAFTRWDGTTIDEFTGLANFKEMLTDQVLWTAAINLVWMLAALFIKLIPPLVIAVVLYHVASKRLRYYFRVMFVLPLVVPGIVYWMVWKLLYQPAPSGIFNAILLPIERWLQSMGHDVALAQNWLADPRTALGAVIFLGFPWVSTLGVLIYLAGLENIDPSLFEAAEIDGAGPLKKLLHIELPLLMRQIKLNLVLGLIATIQGFGTILFLTQGGPAYGTTVPGYQMYDEAFKLDRLGYASAIGLVMFIVILVATLTTSRVVKAQD
jgi:ABC-type sugar transport system permease subunit/ABC-type glycerol-3-phosphate transport system substrate-binding protein